MIFVAGGRDTDDDVFSSVDVITLDGGDGTGSCGNNIPDLPYEVFGPSATVDFAGNVLVCGGNVNDAMGKVG